METEREPEQKKKGKKKKKRTVTSKHPLSSATLNAASTSAIPSPSFWQGGSTLTWQTRRRVRSGKPYIEKSVAMPATTAGFLLFVFFSSPCSPFSSPPSPSLSSPSSTASSRSHPSSRASIGDAASM